MAIRVSEQLLVFWVRQLLDTRVLILTLISALAFEPSWQTTGRGNTHEYGENHTDKDCDEEHDIEAFDELARVNLVDAVIKMNLLVPHFRVHALGYQPA